MRDITAAIVNFNTKDFIEKCIDSLIMDNQIDASYVIVVDNASTDGSVKYLQKKYPNVKIIKNEKNTGFAHANNRAIKEAKTKYILVLNPDTVVLKNSVKKMTDFMDENKEIGICGPLIVNPDFSFQISNTNFPDNINLLFESFFFDRIIRYFKPRAKSGYADYLQGSCLIIRKDVFDDIGYFDEEYFMYFEETDFCFRAKKAGWKTYILSDASVIHSGGGNTGYYDERRICYYFQSMIYFYKKHYAKISLFFLRIILLIRSVVRLFSLPVFYAFNFINSAQLLSKMRGYAKVIIFLAAK